MYESEDAPERVRRESEGSLGRIGRRERLAMMARAHLTRHNILVVLESGGGKKELRARQIHRLILSEGRPSLAVVKYHLRVLCAQRRISVDDDPEDPLYKLI